MIVSFIATIGTLARRSLGFVHCRSLPKPMHSIIMIFIEHSVVVRFPKEGRLGRRLGRRLGPSWGLSWGCLGRLGASFFRSSDHLGAFHFSIAFSMPSWIDFWLIFDPNLLPKNHQNPPKIDARMPSHVDLPFCSIFDRFWLPTWIPEPQKSLKIH